MTGYLISYVLHLLHIRMELFTQKGFFNERREACHHSASRDGSTVLLKIDGSIRARGKCSRQIAAESLLRAPQVPYPVDESLWLVPV